MMRRRAKRGSQSSEKDMARWRRIINHPQSLPVKMTVGLNDSSLIHMSDTAHGV